jgi:hypothetical protein
MADQGSVCSGEATTSAGRRTFQIQNARPAIVIAARAAAANQTSRVRRAGTGTSAGIATVGAAESVDGASAICAVSMAFAGGAGAGGATLWMSGIYEPGGSSMRKSDWCANAT